MISFGVLPALGRNHQPLTPQRADILQQTRKVLGWHKMLWSEDEPEPWVVYFLSLSHNLSYADTSHNYDRLGFAPANKNMLLRERGDYPQSCARACWPGKKKEENRGAKSVNFAVCWRRFRWKACFISWQFAIILRWKKHFAPHNPLAA